MPSTSSASFPAMRPLTPPGRRRQQTVDNAHMRYFVVHLHRLLDPGQDTKPARLKKLVRNLLRSRWVQRAVGFLAAEYLRLVWLTNRFSFEPANVYEMAEPHQPLIFAFWHGQHFLTPFIKTKDSHRAKVLISRHRDGEFNAIAAERLGIETIRGSGDHGGAFHRKGGVGAFREMVQALEQGYNVASTADVPKRSRVAGMASSCWRGNRDGRSCRLPVRHQPLSSG